MNDLANNIDLEITPIDKLQFSIPNVICKLNDPPPQHNIDVFINDHKESSNEHVTEQNVHRSHSELSSSLLDKYHTENDDTSNTNDENDQDSAKPTFAEKLATIYSSTADSELFNLDKKENSKFLMKQSCELSGDSAGESLFKRLEEIWSELGFSASQKLNMTIKYSSNAEETSKLSDALNI